MHLVYLSPVPWASFAQRPHKFVRWFHERTGKPVLWIDPYPTRFPELADIKRFKIRGEKTNINNDNPSWLEVVNVNCLPVEPLPRAEIINYFLWKKALNKYRKFSASVDTALVIGKPSLLALSFLKTKLHSFSLYDAMDEFPAFYKGYSRIAFMKREILVAQLVDEIWASSRKLKNRWGNIKNKVRLVPNGLDVALIIKLLENSKKKSSDKKIFGYVGTIASWFDWEWIIALACERSNDEIRLIGPVFTEIPNNLPNNIKFFPPCEHSVALQAMSEFDVGLIPFKSNELTSSVDPIKYYEYRSLGVPTLSTNFGEMSIRENENGVFLSHSLSDIGLLSTSSLNFFEELSDARNFAINNSWKNRFDDASVNFLGAVA